MRNSSRNSFLSTRPLHSRTWSTPAGLMKLPGRPLLPFVPHLPSCAPPPPTRSRRGKRKLRPRTHLPNQLFPASVVQDNTPLLTSALQRIAPATTVVAEVIGPGHGTAPPSPLSAGFVVAWGTTTSIARRRTRLLCRVVLPVTVPPHFLHGSLRPHGSPPVVA